MPFARLTTSSPFVMTVLVKKTKPVKWPEKPSISILTIRFSGTTWPCINKNWATPMNQSIPLKRPLEYAGENSIKGSARTQLITVLMQKALAEDKGHMHRALELIEEGLWENRNDKTLLYKKAFAYYQLGEFDRAIEAFDELARLGPLSKGPTISL